tara:strand:+ start:4655 stop:5173 length:519 start_codon:yes stop_codon:yes gene_type:complete
MRVFKSVGINFNNFLILFFLGVVAISFINGGFDNLINLIIENYLLFIILLISVFILSLNEVIADRVGITKRLYLIPILSKTKTWKEIKCYAHVKEVYDGQYGPTSLDALWFIDFNDKVCLRIPKSGRLNMPDVMKIIEKFEDQYEVSLEIKNPYRMSKGWSKVDYSLTQKNK